MSQTERIQKIIDGWLRGDSLEKIAADTNYSVHSVPKLIARLREVGHVLPPRRTPGRPKLDLVSGLKVPNKLSKKLSK